MTKIKDFFRNSISFFRESYGELKQSVWLSKDQMFRATVLVIIVVAIVAVYISLIDMVLVKLLGLVIGGR